MDKRFEKLPKWAKGLIQRLASERDEAVKALHAPSTVSSVFYQPIPGDRLSRVYLPEREVLQFGGLFDLHWNPDQKELTVRGRLRAINLRPEAANSVVVSLRDKEIEPNG